MRRNIVLLGSTGSIGRQTLDVARAQSDRVRVWGLAAGSHASLLAHQMDEFAPVQSVLTIEAAMDDASRSRGIKAGDEAIIDMCTHPEVDLVVVATSGAAGLRPTLAALRAGKLVALANKETLVMAGPLIKRSIRDYGGALVPIDSEHSAIWQCLQGEDQGRIERITLTASGGALRGLPLAALHAVTPSEALHHPTWSMGRKITIDSANLMNKGLEVLEARWLFDVSLEHIDVIQHSQSIVHSLVTFADGSVKAQLGMPDMRLPIQYALSHPERWTSTLSRLDLADNGTLTFDRIDRDRYPILNLTEAAGRNGGTAPAILCAADEIAVDAFLAHRIRFTDIVAVVAGVLDKGRHCASEELQDILDADMWARAEAAEQVVRYKL